MSPGNYGHTSTYYDIHYDYVIDGQVYSEIIDSVNYSKNIGDSLDSSMILIPLKNRLIF